MPTGGRNSPSKKKKTISDAAAVINLAGYASTHGAMFASGERIVPITVSSLKYAKNRNEELRQAPPTPKSIFRKESASDKERKTFDVLFKCFRECPKLRIQPGSKSVDCSSIDLEDFYSLENIEFVGCTIGEIQHPPLGLELVSLVQSFVMFDQLGEQLQTIAIDDSMEVGIDLSGLAKLSNVLIRLEINNSIKSLKSLKDIFGSLQWKILRTIEITNNPSVDVMDSFFEQLRVVRAMKLSGNSITTVRYLSKCSTLTYLDLSNNNIETVADTVFPRSLTKIDLRSNKLNTLDGLYTLPGLCVLTVDDNKIRSWNEIFHLLKVNNNLQELSLTGNPSLKSSCLNYRPLVAGMLDFNRWRGFLLDSDAFTSEDTNKTTVKSVCGKYKQFFLPPDEVSTPIIIGEDSPVKARTRQVDLCPEYTFTGPCEPCVAGCLVVLALLCGLRKSASGSGSATSDANLQLLPQPSYTKTKKITKKKIIVTKTKIVRRRADRGSVFQTPEKGSGSNDNLSPVEAHMSSGDSIPQQQVEDVIAADSELISSYDNLHTPETKETVTYGSIDVQKGGFLNGIVSHSLSDGTSTTIDIPDPILTEVDDSNMLSESEIEGTTSVSWRTFVEEVSERLSSFLEAGTITPKITRVASRKWGSSKIVPFAGSYPYHISLLPPNMIDPEPSRFVALDATIIGESLMIRIRRSESSTVRSISEIINDLSGDGIRTGDGFSTIHVELFKDHGVQEASPPASTINFANVKTWEVGEPKPWDPKSVTVEPSKSDMYVTTNRGVTYLQRKQQSELKGRFHPASENVLMAGFEVQGEECEEVLIAMLKARLKKCKKAPEWPIVSNKGSASTGKQVFSFDHPPFRSELSNCKKIATSDVRILSKLQIGAEDVFMYFGSTVSGSRRLDLEALEKYDVRVGVHILQNNDQAHDVNEGEQLVGSCYCSVLLGAASEQEKGKSAKEPFLLISCHQNKDLKKVEVGYGMQYTRLVYGGDTGQTYLLLPRCGKSTLHLLRMLTASKTASVDGKITICSSPFTARPLVQGQSAVVGYFLVFMRQEQLVTQKRSMKDISSMAFPQDVYPLRELSHQMLPVSIIITKEEILVASDKYASWPDEEGIASRWHLEKRGLLGDIVQIGTSTQEDSVNRMRFSLDFEQEDEKLRWNFCAQTINAVDDITSLIQREWEQKWRMPLTVNDLDTSDDPVSKRSKIRFRKEGSMSHNVASSM